MKVFWLVMLIFCTCTLVYGQSSRQKPVKSNKTYQGTWQWENRDKIFILELIQTDDQIKGYHDIEAKDGRKVDSISPNEGFSINGVIKGKEAVIDFICYLSDVPGSKLETSTIHSLAEARGVAIIQLNGNRLSWKIIKTSGQDFYLPQQAVLKRADQGFLIFSAMKDSAGEVQALIEAGVKIDIQDNKGKTALIYAAEQGHINTVKVLLNAKADTAIKDRNGRTALDYATKNNHREIIELLSSSLNTDSQ